MPSSDSSSSSSSAHPDDDADDDENLLLASIEALLLAPLASPPRHFCNDFADERRLRVGLSAMYSQLTVPS